MRACCWFVMLCGRIVRSECRHVLVMAEQIEVIKEGNAQVLAAFSEMAELSDDIRALVEACAEEAGSPVCPGDA